MHEHCKDCHEGYVPKEEFEKLQAEVIELRKLVKILMNPKIPSSKKIIKEKEAPKEPKKLGAPVGHKGATRERPVITETVYHEKPTRCINKQCTSEQLLIEEFKDTIEDVKIVKIAKEIHGYSVLCTCCGKVFRTFSEDLPSVGGKFGPNITSLWTIMHYIGTIPFDRLSKISKHSFGIEITATGLHDVIYRNSKIFEPTFDTIKENVRNSRYDKSDETKYSDDWLWNIGSEQDTLVLIRPSRGSGVLEEVLGKTYLGILGSDCFSAYEKFEAKEYAKCWSHILLDAKDLAKHNSEGVYLHKELSRMYNYIGNAKKNKEEGTEKVKFWIWRQKQEMKLWMEKKYESKAVLNLVKRINKYLNQWFTCLKYDFVEPTNNASERDIRKNVIARKISGCHRSQKGKHSREIMMSTILTAQKREIDPFEFIHNTIKNHNLGIVTYGF